MTTMATGSLKTGGGNGVALDSGDGGDSTHWHSTRSASSPLEEACRCFRSEATGLTVSCTCLYQCKSDGRQVVRMFRYAKRHRRFAAYLRRMMEPCHDNHLAKVAKEILNRRSAGQVRHFDENVRSFVGRGP
eukprot:s2167_g6.t2